ncbi:phosphotransferase [Actinomadura physcomitrii]|uniref:phosphotransferase n=1 Tax=Actinomadura physcomitrii TaxID=2650748 RepID=UPI00136C06A0|nr:phosphotransferase [Actinomadura physcomitrii]
MEAGGWLVLAFEHVQARHADCTPGSRDLDVLAKIIDSLQTHPLPDVLERKRVERRWESICYMSPLAGDTLLHADLNPANVLLRDDNTAHVVDWTFTGRGAAFLEMALLIPWLLKAGHTPAEAEHWTSRFAAWTTTARPPSTCSLAFSPANGEPTSPPTTRLGRLNTRVQHRNGPRIGIPNNLFKLRKIRSMAAIRSI